MTPAHLNTSTASLKTHQLEVGFAGQAILPPIDLNLGHNQFWALIGSNGSGKSTLLRTLLGLHNKVGGQIEMCQGCKIGYVPQRSSVDLSVPTRVIDIVRSGADHQWSFLRPSLGQSAAESVHEAITDMDLLGLERRQFNQLSEGQKQRVLMARALASQPSIFVLDEPTSAMDFEAEAKTFVMLQKVRVARKLTILMVSHQIPILLQNASHIVLLDKERKLVVVGNTEEVQGHAFFEQRYGKLTGEASL